MPLKIVMPKLGLTMTEGTLVEWTKKEGDSVKAGEVIFILETEKVAYEVEAPEDGTLGKIIIHSQDTVPVGEIVAYLLRPGETLDDLNIETTTGDQRTEEPETLNTESTVSQPDLNKDLPPETNDMRIKATPMAKKAARELHIDLRTVRGTGPGGRIIREDVKKKNEEQQTAPTLEPTHKTTGQKLVPFTGMRRAIAKKMLSSKVETAQTYMSNTVNATNVKEYRKLLLSHLEKKTDVRVTITDIMMKITAAALKEHPVMNTRWTDDGILYFDDVHMGMAMALDEGLIVPVIRDINRKSIMQVAENRQELIGRGRNKKFLPDDITGSTFTLSAMGMYGIEQFTSNINLPENAILAVGAIIDKPVAINGELAIRPMMNITLTYDHRTIDGSEAGKFMQTLTKYIENPILMAS
jgi:pyruvate dehydrogenase E2 component (dihydrolipoamide acetyltransferase)